VTFVVKIRGDSTAPIAADFLCTLCGVFESLVPRNASDFAPCPRCGADAPWWPSPVRTKIPSFSVERGGWQKAERPGWLDTRNLGEGQDLNDFRADRARIRDEERRRNLKREIKEYLE
jgi:hypothetical protein